MSNAAAYSFASRQDELKFSEDIFKLVLQHMKTNNSGKVVDFKLPNELEKIIDFSLPSNGQSNETLLALCKSTLQYSINTHHPMFMNQQFAKADPYGIAADIFATSINTNPHTYEVAPVFIMAEKAILERSLQLFGYTKGEGTFCPGGSYSNMLALNLSKFYKFPEAKEKGLAALPKVALFCSKQCHYSVKKNVVLLGFGTDCIVSIDCDNQGKIIAADFEKKLLIAKEQEIVPLFLHATAGTTVLGAFDPFDELADICKEHDVWMHADGAWGGSVMFSESHKHLCKGIDRADSVAWNPHKMMSAPLQCSLFLTKHTGMMTTYHSFHVPYLFQQDKPYDTSYDIGTNLIQAGRRIDSFKFWLMWKARGDKGFEQVIDKAFDNTKYFISELKKRKNFEMVIENPEYTNISFWYVPNSILGQEKNEKYWKKMQSVAPEIKSRMLKVGSLMLGYQPLDEKVNFFRLIVISKDLSHDDMDFILNEIDRLGCDL